MLVTLILWLPPLLQCSFINKLSNAIDLNPIILQRGGTSRHYKESFEAAGYLIELIVQERSQKPSARAKLINEGQILPSLFCNEVP